ncbi:hypothetical protein STEG23_019790, partial [Scotinomys teguina]
MGPLCHWPLTVLAALVTFFILFPSVRHSDVRFDVLGNYRGWKARMANRTDLDQPEEYSCEYWMRLDLNMPIHEKDARFKSEKCEDEPGWTKKGLTPATPVTEAIYRMCQ